MAASSAFVIEDDIVLGGIFAEILEDNGFTTCVLHDGTAAVSQVSEQPPQLILLDVHLPHVSGEEILIKLRADPRLATIHIIVVTADAQRADTLKQHANHVLLKPVSLDQLTNALAQLAAPDADSNTDS